VRQVHSIERIAKDKKKGETEIRKRDTRDRRRDRCKAVQCGCFEFKEKNERLDSRRHGSLPPTNTPLGLQVEQAEQGISRRRKEEEEEEEEVLLTAYNK